MKGNRDATSDSRLTVRRVELPHPDSLGRQQAEDLDIIPDKEATTAALAKVGGISVGCLDTIFPQMLITDRKGR